ncbi:MAG: choice-of-anchor D domain-containing protein [Calditrichaeota bacterium]|nr:choice-of-anchor D domain-containing protein [Calditrichota bacterium]
MEKIKATTLFMLFFLCLFVVTVFGQPEPEISPVLYDFGDVEVGTSETIIISVTNIGFSDLIISDYFLQAVSSNDFSVIHSPRFPDVPVAIAESDNYDLEVTYSPSSTGPASAVLEVISNGGTVTCALSGTGVNTELTPEEQIENILQFIDDSVANGTLEGSGNRPWLAKRRLRAFKKIIKRAQRQILRDHVRAACVQLQLAYKRCDGNPRPVDFVIGESVPELAAMIQNLKASLECGTCHGSLGKQLADDQIETETSAPAEFDLEQNYPNPFNPKTNISYSLADDSHVKITIFNTLGQQIEVLVNEFQSQGHYSVTWEAKDLPAGLYLYRLESDGFNSNKKMFLLK